MSEEQLKAFIAKAKGDSSLQDKLKEATSTQQVVDIAQAHGYKFSTDHLNQLSEEELEGLTGSASSINTCGAYTKCRDTCNWPVC